MTSSTGQFELKLKNTLIICSCKYIFKCKCDRKQIIPKFFFQYNDFFYLKNKFQYVAYIIKLFTAVIYITIKKAIVFVIVSHLDQEPML
jgi:hypothetical protein